MRASALPCVLPPHPADAVACVRAAPHEWAGRGRGTEGSEAQGLAGQRVRGLEASVASLGYAVRP